MKLTIILIGGRVPLQGEVCMAGSRVFVQEGIYDEFVNKIAESSKDWVIGDPFDPHVNQGPQVVFFQEIINPCLLQYILFCS